MDRSELLRDALHRHLVTLRSQREGDHYDEFPITASELALADIADWGPAEDWADWAETPIRTKSTLLSTVVDRAQNGSAIWRVTFAHLDSEPYDYKGLVETHIDILFRGLAADGAAP